MHANLQAPFYKVERVSLPSWRYRAARLYRQHDESAAILVAVLLTAALLVGAALLA